MRYMKRNRQQIKSNVFQNRQVAIVTIHNYGKIYEVDGDVSLQHIGGDW